MADDGSEGQSETGGSLRSQLEATIAERNQMAQELLGFRAAQEISAKGYKHVTAEDLKGVKLDELPAKAAQIEKDKLAVRETVLRDVLKDQGYEDGERLDEAVKKLITPDESHAETSSRLANLGRINGDFPGAHEEETLTGRKLLQAHFGKQEKQSSRR